MKSQSTILIAEDEYINQQILKRILMDTYDLVFVSDGQEAIRVLDKEPEHFSAVILDLVMPKVNGFGVMAHIKELHSLQYLPILVSTGDITVETEEKCFSCGAWDFVGKPFEPATIKARLRNIIGRSRTSYALQLKEMAERDTLTGLYNRSFFMKQTSHMYESYPEEQFVLVCMDIDRFRNYNTFLALKKGI